MKDIYVKFTKKNNSKEIIGESLDDAHRDWVEVNSWSHEIIQPKSATASTAGGHASERCEHLPMVFEKDVDKASVYLWEACSAAYAYDVEVQFFRATGTVRTNYLTIKLSNAIISRVTMQVPQKGLLTESFEVKYAKVTWEHKGSKADGTANVGRDPGGWDLAANKAAV